MSGIDHLVLATRDLETARMRYRALGFTLTPPARHPFGTGNSLVQLDGAFLELLSVMAPQDVPEPEGDCFSFAAFNRDYLSNGEGFSMLVLASDDARRERQRMQAAGLETYEPFDFSRRAKLPSGEEVTVGFSLAFTSHRAMPAAGFFYCQQHAPQHFWKAEYQRHANTATTIEEVGLVADVPGDIAAFMAAFADAKARAMPAGGIEVDTGRGRLTIRTPADFGDHWGFAAPAGHPGARLAAFRLGVVDLATARDCVADSGVAAVTGRQRIVIAPRHLYGTGLVLAQRGAP